MAEIKNFIFMCKTQIGQHGLLTEDMEVYLQLIDINLIAIASDDDVGLELTHIIKGCEDEYLFVVPVAWLAKKTGLPPEMQDKLCSSIEAGVLKFYGQNQCPDVPTVKEILKS